MSQHFLTPFLFVFLAIVGVSSSVNTTQKIVENSNQSLESDLTQILSNDGIGGNVNVESKSHVLFFFPVITKSAKITFMPVAEKMAERGHKVGVIEDAHGLKTRGRGGN